MNPDIKIVKRLWHYLKPYWRMELIALFVMMALSCLALALPHAIRYMIDDLIPSLMEQGDTDGFLMPVVLFGLFLVGIYLLNVLFSWYRDYLAARIGANIIADIRLELFDHLERVSLRFFQKKQVGEIMSRLLSDVQRIQDLLTSNVLSLLNSIFLLLAIFVYLLNISWILTIIALVPVPLTIILSNRFGRKLHVISRKVQETIARLSARVQEAFLSTRTIRSFGQEAYESKRVDGVLDVLKGHYIKNAVTNSLAHNLVQFVNMIGPIVILAWGTYLVASGHFKLGTLIAFYILLSYLYSPIQDIASLNVQVQGSMASVKRIFEYLDIPTAVVEDPNPQVLSGVEGAISFRDISFSYDDTGFRMENLSLDIKPCEKVAIVGPSGSGKTTIINLIMRFFDAQSGIIEIDGVDICRLSLNSLRGNIGLVDQEPLLFKASIYDNIAYADPAAKLDDVIAAAKIANIHDFISGLSEGYQNEIGERGVTLSGGEKQRMCLARAILKDPPILILDEATSSLDSNSEQLIQEALSRVLVNKTAIIIAHRLSTVQHADRIITMDNGRIVAEGTHDELLESSPLYRQLASKQLMI
jgi:subfamily B ATP-binding cassette protein MsbA